MKKLLISSLVIIVVLIGFGAYSVSYMVKQNIATRLEYLHKKALWQSEVVSEYLTSFPNEAEFYIGKNDLLSVLEADEISPDIYRDIKKIHSKHHAAIDSIIIAGRNLKRSFGHTSETSISRGKIEPSFEPLKKNKQILQSEGYHRFVYPVFDSSGELRGNISFILNLNRLFEYLIQNEAYDRETWVCLYQDGRITFVYSDNEKFVEDSPADISGLRDNLLTSSGQGFLSRKAELNLKDEKFGILYAYQPLVMVGTQTGVIYASESALALSWITKIASLLSLIFVLILVTIITGFLIFIKLLRKEELALMKIRNAVDKASDLILITDLDFGAFFANHAFQKLLGYHSHANSQPVDLIFSGAKMKDTIRDQLLKSGSWDSEIDIKLADNRIMPSIVRANYISDNEGNPIGILFIAMDISERKKAEKIKNEFISTVSHELRTPLTSIRGSLGLIRGGIAGELPAQIKKLIDIAYSNSERLIHLINDILDIEKIEAGGMEFHIEQTEVLPLVEKTIALLKDYGAQYDVKIELRNKLPEIKSTIDPDRFEQVMNNLISNACKFSRSGGIVYVDMEKTPENKLRVSVIDQGIGIPEEFKGRIFKKFAQVDSSDSRSKGGTGLGLSISKAIIERFSGTIDYHSVPELGTTFCFDLPIIGESIEPNPLLRPASDTCILVIEDDKDIATLISMVLHNAGYQTEIAYSAEEAKNKLATRTYALITLDLLLPQQEGISLIQELRGSPETADIPIVVISAIADQKKDALHGGFGIVDWISKPIDMDRLRRAILDTLGEKTKPKILYVEDDADIIEILKQLIGEQAELLAAETIGEARQLIAEKEFDLVILDQRLPDGNGLELIPIIHNNYIDPIPIVVFSAYDTDYNEDVAVSLVKSKTSNEELIKTIASILNHKSMKHDIKTQRKL
ncbi:MAG: response regulator [Candidatus Cloacimonetes bacterium]|nr:response regulator [Candidatus Cloacimonadota bacterium]